MKITNLVLTFLITGFLAGDAYGENEVFYCSEDIPRVYRDGNFEKSGVTGKFRIKLDRPLETELVQWGKK
tara:strand:+ start:142 stop:351 length:210 start_codon:yes stop_codon:yes gene_type:complete